MSEAAQIDQEMEYNQQQMNDLFQAQTAKMFEGVEDEYNNLGNDEMLDALGKYETTQPQKDTNKTPAQTEKNAKNTKYDAVLQDLLSN